MGEPRRLSRLLVDVIHSELVSEHGGSPGIRAGGEDLIESALMRPAHRFADKPEADLAALAAEYLFGLARNHGYVDGNKRTAFAAAATFLLLNGIRLTGSEVETYDIVIAVSDGRLSAEDLAAWIRQNSAKS